MCLWIFLVIFATAVGEVRTDLVPVTVLNHGDSAQYSNCHSIYKAGYEEKGLYRLHIDGDPKVMTCDFNNIFKILSRQDIFMSFNKSFHEFENGFSDKNGNYWAGLIPIHAKLEEVRWQKPHITISLTDWDNKIYSCVYHTFRMRDRIGGYRLDIGGFKETGPGKMGDSLKDLDGAEFWARDRPDRWGCVSGMQTGWWYSGDHCTKALPTGHYYRGSYTKSGQKWDGLFWYDCKGWNYSFKKITIDLLFNV